jgi:HEPN superfamily Swt1-like protein
MKHDDLYSFVYRGVLTEEALDRAGRRKRSHFGAEDARALQQSLSYHILDAELLAEGQRMSIVYGAVHAFENSVRAMVTKAMNEKHGVTWWDKVPERIRKTSKTRMEEDAKFRWHGARGSSEINYCDFGDLSSIIVTNWEVFEDLLGNMEWAKATLNSLEKSRNIVMHGGSVAKEDVERIGMNIRDWIRQAG